MDRYQIKPRQDGKNDGLTGRFGIREGRYDEMKKFMSQRLASFVVEEDEIMKGDLAPLLNDIIGFAENTAEIAFMAWKAAEALERANNLGMILRASQPKSQTT